MIYFIHNAAGAVKIGFTNTDPIERLKALQTGSKESLYLGRVIEGGKAVERYLHLYFAPERLRGEWFRHIPEMDTVQPPFLTDSEPAANESTSGRTFKSYLYRAASLGLLTPAEIDDLIELGKRLEAVRDAAARNDGVA